MKQRPPVIAVRKTSSVPLDDWNGIETLFASADFAPLGQAWLDEPEPPFRGARAAAIRTDDALVVYGEMDDDDMYNDVPESEFNRIAINFGDMFEVFVQPCRQDAYYEIHISPNNQKFQLRLPCPYALKKYRDTVEKPGDLIAKWSVWSPVVESRVRLMPEQKKWQVIVSIPFKMIVENGMPPSAGDKWLFSFSRYDYTRPEPKPIFSSTSPHAEVNYHRIEEWGTMVLL